MKNLFLFLFANILLLKASGQSYWQQRVNYTIDVSLNDKEKTLDAFETIIYTNHSPDTLRFIWFHLWPNGYKNDRTALSDDLLQNGDTRFYFANKEQRGYINRLDFKVDGSTSKTEDHPQHIDIVKLLLPKPLLPNQTITITTPFFVKLPYQFSRSGYDGQSFQIAQWYPKPAVYDRHGWHPMPYLDKGEFYSEFGSFDVRITLPKEYVVAATGELQDEEEKRWLKTRADFLMPETPKKPTLKKSPAKSRTRNTAVKAAPSAPPSTPILQGRKTLHYQQDNVHDFAWFANKNFIVKEDTLQLASGRIVEVSSFYTPDQKTAWQNSLSFAKEALRFFSSEVGEYPYNAASVVQGPESAGSGMEYPTITLISPTSLNNQRLSAEELDAVIAHELAHNWFYGILATNERANPWMDEGMTSFYEKKYVERRYGPQTKEAAVILQRKAFLHTDQPITTTSENFSSLNYALVAYEKAADWLKSLEQQMGIEVFQQHMREYYSKWKFRHPQPDDFKALVREKLGQNADHYFDLLYTNGALPETVPNGNSLVSLFGNKNLPAYLLRPTKKTTVLLPAVGANSYDKIMAGLLVSNEASTVARFNYTAIPLYAFGSKSFTGLARLNYHILSTGAVRRTDIFLNASSFHVNEFRDSADTRYRMRFIKLVPGMRFTFQERDAKSTVKKYIQWKTFLFREQFLNVSTDSVFTSGDTTVQYRYSTPAGNRYLNQLQLVYQNSRALYPFDAALQVEQAQDFLRTTFTGNYFFNYAKAGGLAVRLFAGKFSYLNGKTVRKQFNNDRYHLNLTGANGFEDYTYGDYFIGRNRYEGIPSQQIMIRDGAFKVRTDLLASKVGKTDNWLTAVNLVSTVPEKINPLSVLKIPLRVFADIGTYAEAWDRDNNADRFLFDAGLQLSLVQETIHIYVPLLYSGIFRTYLKSTIPENRFLKTVSFSIKLNNKLFKKIDRVWEF